jgi:hypothetical protein
MRLTIIAGVILGASLAVHSAVGAHARAKAVHAASAVRLHVKEIAPWYVAVNDDRFLFPQWEEVRG